MQLYADSGLLLVTSADIDILVRYCITVQELSEATELRNSEYNNGCVDDIDNFVKYSTLQDKLTTKMMRLSDLLYLNPVSRARTGGKTPNEKPANKLEELGFGGV
jgi:hypothetical protein